MQKNCGIKCDVVSCKHNSEGCCCELEQVKITKDCGCGENCTCCDDFCEKI